jgi:acyl-CoA hydrolase
VNSTSHKGRIVSGVGGGGDFAAAGARGEASIIALFSTTPDGASTIVPAVEAVSIPGSHVTHIVTEWGVARLRQGSSSERARAVAAIARPDNRALIP